MSGKIIFREQFGSTDKRRSYRISSDGRLLACESSRRFQSIAHALRTIFLPQGYPESVSEDYLSYQIYDTVQAFASSITGTLATQALLTGMGVGDQSATAMAATITWILKDGTGMVGRILFAWSKGISLDYDAKRWRLFADVLNDAAIFFEIAAPHFPIIFTPVVCIAGVCKSIVGVAGGATRAALTQHQARRNNMADVSAKDGSQETLVNLSALLCSLLLVPLVSGNMSLQWLVFVLFTILHLYANYLAVKSVVMETINQARLHIIVTHYFASACSEVVGVKAGNSLEPVLWGTRWLYETELGAPLKNLTDRVESLESLLHLYREERYIVGVNKGRVRVVLHTDSNELDHLAATFQAEVINVVAQGCWRSSACDAANLVTALSSGNMYAVSEASYLMVKKIFPKFLVELQAQGWVTSPVLLGAGEWRADWNLAPLSVNEHHVAYRKGLRTMLADGLQVY